MCDPSLRSLAGSASVSRRCKPSCPSAGEACACSFFVGGARVGHTVGPWHVYLCVPAMCGDAFEQHALSGQLLVVFALSVCVCVLQCPPPQRLGFDLRCALRRRIAARFGWQFEVGILSGTVLKHSCFKLPPNSIGSYLVSRGSWANRRCRAILRPLVLHKVHVEGCRG